MSWRKDYDFYQTVQALSNMMICSKCHESEVRDWDCPLCHGNGIINFTASDVLYDNSYRGTK